MVLGYELHRQLPGRAFGRRGDLALPTSEYIQDGFNRFKRQYVLIDLIRFLFLWHWETGERLRHLMDAPLSVDDLIVEIHLVEPPTHKTVCGILHGHHPTKSEVIASHGEVASFEVRT